MVSSALATASLATIAASFAISTSSSVWKTYSTSD